jgi:hypothetical protein
VLQYPENFTAPELNTLSITCKYTRLSIGKFGGGRKWRIRRTWFKCKYTIEKESIKIVKVI